MALPTLPHRSWTNRPAGAEPPTRVLPGSARELVLTAPMLLFAHGILAWIDDLGHHGRNGVIWFLAQAALIGSVLAFAGLAGGLAHVVRDAPATRLPANAALGSAIVGTGLTTWVALVRGAGGGAATAGAPGWLLAGGPVLLGASLFALLALVRPALGLPIRTLGLAAAGLVLLALPFDLIPLAAIVLVLALEPLLATDPDTLEGDGPFGAG